MNEKKRALGILFVGFLLVSAWSLSLAGCDEDDDDNNTGDDDDNSTGDDDDNSTDDDDDNSTGDDDDNSTGDDDDNDNSGDDDDNDDTGENECGAPDWGSSGVVANVSSYGFADEDRNGVVEETPLTFTYEDLLCAGEKSIVFAYGFEG